jgi:hypothetical protein
VIVTGDRIRLPLWLFTAVSRLTPYPEALVALLCRFAFRLRLNLCSAPALG